VSAWDELDQRVIDTAVRQWRIPLLINVHTLCLCAFDILPYVCCKLPLIQLSV